MIAVRPGPTHAETLHRYREELSPRESAIEILTITSDADRLAVRVDAATRAELEALSHTATEPAAFALASRRPAAAAKLRTALALRILAQKRVPS